MKRRFWISLAIILTLVIGIFAIGASALDNEPELRITGANLQFAERVNMLFAVDSNVSDKENVTLLVFRGKDITVDKCVKGREVAVVAPGDDANDPNVKGVKYLYTDIAAAEMTEDIYVRAYYTDSDGVAYYSDVVKYSILQYACNKLGITGTATTNPELVEMLEGMLIYGAAAQKYFDVNEDRLATDEYVRIELKDATFSDGLSKALIKKGDTFSVKVPTTGEKPYVVWTDANGKTVASGTDNPIVATANKTYVAKTQAAEPSFGGYKYVVIVGVDGAGSFYLNETNTPNIDSIFANGALTETMRVASPSASSVSWMSALHGVKPENHGNMENSEVEAGVPYTMDSKYPSILRVVKEARPDEEVAAIYSWSGINGIVEDEAGITKKSLGDAAIASYLEGGYIKENTPTLLYIHLNEPDYIGHTAGHRTDKYYQSLETTDGYIGRIYNAYVNAGIIDDTLFILTSDHGGEGTSHGGLTDNEKYAIFAVAGKNVTNTRVEDMYIRDISAVALHALGIEQPETYTSIVPNGIFADTVAGERTEYHDPDAPRYHLPEATPAVGTDGYITNYVDRTLEVYLPFDGNTTELVGNSQVDSFGKITYEDGYFGRGVQLEDGHLNVYTDFTPGTESFTISTWAKFATPTNGWSPIIATKTWHSADAGFSFASGRYATSEAQTHYGMFEIANGSSVSRIDKIMFPEDYLYGWMHLLITVDKESGFISVSYDFGEPTVLAIPEAMKTASLDAIVDYIVLGNDPTGTCAYKSGVALDEFMIFNGVFSEDDYIGLAEYFGIPTNRVPDTDENVMDAFAEGKAPELYFDFNGFTNNEGTHTTDLDKHGKFDYGEGVSGQSLYIDGQKYFTVEDFDFGTGSYSVAGWFNFTDLSYRSGAKLPLLSTSATNGRETLGLNVMLTTEYGRLNVTMGDGANGMQTEYQLFCPAKYVDNASFNKAPLYSELENKWMHIAVSVNRETRKITIYIDFEAVLTADVKYYGTSTLLSDDYCPDNFPLTIGQFGVPQSTTPKYYVDDLMVFNRAIDKYDVYDMFDYYKKPLSDYISATPVVDLDFDRDLDNAGTYNGTVAEDGTLAYTDGKIGSALVTKNGSVDLEDLKIGNNSFTVSMWLNVATFHWPTDVSWSHLFSTGHNSNTEEPGIHIALRRDVKAILINTCNEAGTRGYSLGYYDQVPEVKENEWWHLTVIVETNPADGKSYVRMFINFAEIKLAYITNGSAFATNSFDGAEGFTPHIAQDGTGESNLKYSDKIDEFLYFDRALTADEIAALGEYYKQ